MTRQLLEGLIAIAWALPALAQGAPAADPAAASPAAELAPPDAPQATPEQRYAKGKNLFEYGDCAGTLDQLGPLVVPGTLGDERQQLDVHRMLGICLALAGRPIEAARELSSLLAIDPDYSLDPFLTPPVAVEIFEKQKASMRVQLEEIRRAREADKKDSVDGGVLVERVTTVRETPLAAAFLPFGLAQAANDDMVMAVVMGSLQGVSLAVAATGFYGDQIAKTDLVWAASRGGSSSGGNAARQAAVDEAELRQQAFWGVQWVGSMAFVLAYGVGVADALWNYEDRAVVERKQTRRPLTPAEIKAVRKIAPAPPEPTTPSADGPPAPVEP
ncbi:MAG: hypothetical protein HYS27_21400 [Deltaproteobacteria bacterium]|nr:hypothetical protein [Deltaproteobacteria bacterium]